jgi:peptidylprolyl isomerase
MPDMQEPQGVNKAMSVVTYPSGLKKEILPNGTAPEGAKSPEKGKKVTVHYTGWLEENGQKGKKFDSSVDRDQKFSFIIGVGQVIKGWDEGVMTMKVGEKARLTIPAAIGYGTRGAGAAIPPNATLIFDVELFDVA